MQTQQKDLTQMGRRWLKISVIYFVIAVAIGIFMAATHDFTLKPVHAHLNLLGWVSMALFAIAYTLFPHLAGTRLSTAHFWIYNLAVPVQMLMLAIFYSGNAAAEPFLAIASIVVVVAIIAFALNVWLSIDKSATA